MQGLEVSDPGDWGQRGGLFKGELDGLLRSCWVIRLEFAVYRFVRRGCGQRQVSHIKSGAQIYLAVMSQ